MTDDEVRARPESGWSFVILGAVISALGGALTVRGADETPLFVVGVVLAALGSIGLLIGCIAVGVSTGMRHASHGEL